MADELEALFSDDMAEADAPAVESEAPQEPQVDEPAVPEPTPAPQSVETPQQPDAPQPGFAPIAALMDERDKRKALEAELTRYRAQQPAEAPNFFDDPDGFAAHQQRLVDQRLAEQRFAMSDMFARQQHGAESVDMAMAWANERAQADPTFAVGYMQQQNPIDWIVRQHKQTEMLGQIGDKSLDDFIRERVLANPEQFGLAPLAAASAPAAVASPAPAVPPVKVPPRSLATQGSGPSDIRDVATGALAAVDAVFPQ